MTIYSVNDPKFHAYGQVVEGLEDTVKVLTEKLATCEQPESGKKYVPSEPILQNLPEAKVIAEHCFGGQPTELGWCNGFNRQLDCLEYHRSSEFNLGSEDFILLLARQEQVHDFMLDTSDVVAFRVPAGTLIEVYGNTLHYAPCHTDAKKGFRVMVGLPMGTNTARPEIENRTKEDGYMTANNKWLLAHPDSNEAKSGKLVGLKGENINLGECE